MICEYYDKKIIPYLIDALIEETSQIIRRFLMEIIKQFGSKVIPEATKRLNDDRWFVQRNMLYILSETDSKEVAAYIKPFCKNENSKVRVAAIKCLLNAGDTYAVEIIREYLKSDQENYEQAIALSGSFRIKEVVGDLILILTKQERSGADLLNKIPVVRALGDIGDPRALDAFRLIISSNSILFRKILEQLKEEVYKTLSKFSYESVKDLVEAGLKSRNAFIREESLRLHKGKAE
jgi:HEAT repeat protein